MLEVVENQQDPTSFEVVLQLLQGVGGASGGDPERAENGVGYQFGIGHRVERHEEDPVGKMAAIRWATAMARRDFPVPPGPVSVTIRASSRSADTCSISSSRPTRVERGMGTRMVTSRVRSGANSVENPSIST